MKNLHKILILAGIFMLDLARGAAVQPGTVLSQQKISEIAGGFSATARRLNTQRKRPSYKFF